MSTPETCVKHVGPILAVSDMDAVLAFYRDVLLFQVVRNDPGYSIVEKDHGCIHFRLVEGGADTVPSREIYIEVTGIDTLWEHVEQFEGKYKTRDLFTQDYGMREFHIIAPNACLVFVGEKV